MLLNYIDLERNEEVVLNDEILKLEKIILNYIQIHPTAFYDETEDERRIEKVSLCYSVELPFLEEEQQYQVSR